MTKIVVEPPLPITTEFTKIDQVRAIVATHLDAGSFYLPALLIDRMRWNPRLRGLLETRCNGLISTDIQWEAARDVPDARRAAVAWREDWPKIAPAPARKQVSMWGLLLGLAYAQRVPHDDPTASRQLFGVRPFWPGYSWWDWSKERYRIESASGGRHEVVSPAFAPGRRVDPASSAWIVSEPFGTNSWRDGFVHAAWRPWFGLELGTRDQGRGSEKLGLGVMKAKYPRGEGKQDKEALQKYIKGLRNLGREAVVPLEQYGVGPEAKPGFDIEPFEYSGAGLQFIDSALNACAVALAILLLGHNLTSEIKGGSFAAAGVADYIRDDIKNADAAAEWAWASVQLAAPWALINFGDPELAPRARYVTDSPAVNQAMAQTYQALGGAIRELKKMVPALDEEALAERFRLPLKMIERAMAQVPANDVQPAESPAAPAAPPAQDAAAAPKPAGDKGAAPAKPGTPAAAATLALTATDLATVVRVDEARKSVGLEPVGGDEGQRWVAEHAARIREELPGQKPGPGGPAPSKDAAPAAAPSETSEAA